jgi:hypothetical protein
LEFFEIIAGQEVADPAGSLPQQYGDENNKERR